MSGYLWKLLSEKLYIRCVHLTPGLKPPFHPVGGLLHRHDSFRRSIARYNVALLTPVNS